jgi:glycosyltransferase involved in cell wall biosynthesis
VTAPAHLLSVCIPVYRKPPETVQVAIDSAARQLPSGSELLLLPDGRSALDVVDQLRLPDGTRVVASEERLGLVGNWNRCLTSSDGSLVHILHDDDAVAPGFYDAILFLAHRYPEASLYATAARALRGEISTAGLDLMHHSFLLEGESAARFLLEEGDHNCGSVVLTRRAVEREGPFRSEFDYCPDEEAYLRYAAVGGLAVTPAPLYLGGTHPAQASYATWRRADFVQVFIASRVEGARFYGDAMMELAGQSSARGVISLAISLAAAGETRLALNRLDDLAEVYPPSRRWLRYRVARVVLRSRVLLRAFRFRRRLLSLRLQARRQLLAARARAARRMRLKLNRRGASAERRARPDAGRSE